MKLEANLIQFLNVYYPVRTLILVIGEALVVWTSLLLGVVYANWDDQYLVLVIDHGYLKIFVLTLLVLLASYCFDLYDTSRPTTKGELYFRLLMVPGSLAFILAGISFFWPQYVLGNGSTEIGLLFLAAGLIGWRTGFTWLIQLPILIERVYVLGTGERAQRLVQGLRQNPEIGVEVVSWTGRLEGPITRDSVAAHLLETVCKNRVHRIIIAMSDRRGTMPVDELLGLSVQGVKIEEATSWLEKISGKIEVENLCPSWLFLGGGFRRSAGLRLARRVLSVITALICVILALPLFLLLVLAIKLTSKGPVFYIHDAVGKNGRIFKLIKFRTTSRDADAENPSNQLSAHDPRLSLVGRFLGAFRLDDIPQLWSVLKGDMAIVGPRPERREFVEGILKDIPYYPLRHIVLPGLTGWAQVKYGCHSTVEDAREELQYDLYYLKNLSFGLDLLILFRTIKTVLVGPRQHRLNAAAQY